MTYLNIKMPTITIGAKNFIAGESQNDDIADNGFSSESFNLNLTKTKGRLYFRESETDRGAATLTGNIIASAFDKNTSPNDAYFLDDAGAFYTLNGVTFTKRQTAASGTFQSGTSDLIQFRSSSADTSTFATSQAYIVKLSGQDFTEINSEWWSGLDTSNRHPMEIVDDELFIADGNIIYFISSTTTGTAFTLPTGERVTSLRKHPDGVTLLAFTGPVPNFSHTLGGGGKVYFCDPTIRDWTKEVPLSSQVEGSRVKDGVVYVTYGRKLGYFDGNGIQFLKDLKNSGTTYSHNLKDFEDFLMVRDHDKVLFFGNLGNGNVWWKPHRATGGTEVTCLANKGDNKLLVAHKTNKLVEIDFDNSGTTNQWLSNKIKFESEVKIRRIDIKHDKTNAAGTVTFAVNSVDDEGNLDTIKTQTYTNQEVTNTRVQCDITTDTFQLELELSSGTIGFKQIRIYYDPIK